MPAHSHQCRDLTFTRREWLAALTAFGMGRPAWADDDTATDPPGEKEIRALAKRVGLPDFRAERTEHYFGIGDAPAAFMGDALRLCEKLAVSYQKDFKDKGFATALPTKRMAVVILSGRKAYDTFEKNEEDDDQGGHYDVDANRLVMFDFQNDPRRGPQAANVNTFTLVHEATHQLTFSTGLLNRAGDVPLAISEGFATYCETWQLASPKIGQQNRARAQSLPRPDGKGWIAVDRLIGDDSLFASRKTYQTAYAQAWLLIHTLMNARTAGLKGKLAAYLDTIRDRKDESSRIADAEKGFGDLGRLDKELKRASVNRGRG